MTTAEAMVSEIDMELVRANYASQSDEWLQNLAAVEGETLTEEALRELFDEFSRRGLNTTIFFNIMNNKAAIRYHVMEQVLDSVYKEVMKSIWYFAIDEKKKGATDLEIWQNLTGRGLEEEKATLIVWSLEKKVKELIDKSDTEMLTGVGFMVFGGLMALIRQSLDDSPILGCIIVIMGFLRFWNGMNKKGEYKAVLSIVQEEYQDQRELQEA